MSTNQTPNYQLCQWEAEDKVLRTEFNADNAKIDAGIKAVDRRVDSLSSTVAGKASSSALAGLQSVVNGQAAAIAKLGNCILHYSTYTGTADYTDYTAQRTLTFPHRPVALFLMHDGEYCGLFAVQGASSVPVVVSSRSYACNCSWSDNSVTLTSSHTNLKNRTYFVAALLDAET